MHPTLEQLYFKQIPTDLKGEKDNTTSGNTHFQQWTDLDRKVNKEMLDLNHTLKTNGPDITFHPTAAEHAFPSSAHRTFPMTDNM